MNPTWLIEEGVYGHEVEPLIAEIQRQGMAVATIPHRALTRGPLPRVDGRELVGNDCVIGYGTFPFARQIQLHQKWIPGAWANAEALDCSRYFAWFGPYLLNQEYLVLPGVEAIRLRDWVFSVLGRDGRIFLRPTGCQKTFVGRCVGVDDFATALAPARYDRETLVVVARPKAIGREWRLVVAGNEVVAGSQYADSGARAIAPGYPDEVAQFAGSMLAQVPWRPDPLFMLDLCEAEGTLWLVELNGFSCSWLYQSDLAAVVARAGTIAREAREQAAAATDVRVSPA